MALECGICDDHYNNILVDMAGTQERFLTTTLSDHKIVLLCSVNKADLWVCWLVLMMVEMKDDVMVDRLVDWLEHLVCLILLVKLMVVLLVQLLEKQQLSLGLT